MKKILSLLITGTLLIAPLTAFASFEDISEDSEYYEAITYLESTGAIESNENFNPDEPITRAASRCSYQMQG